MKFVGTRRVFSTENEEQYMTIEAFWDVIGLVEKLTKTLKADE